MAWRRRGVRRQRRRRQRGAGRRMTVAERRRGTRRGGAWRAACRVREDLHRGIWRRRVPSGLPSCGLKTRGVTPRFDVHCRWDATTTTGSLLLRARHRYAFLWLFFIRSLISRRRASGIIGGGHQFRATVTNGAKTVSSAGSRAYLKRALATIGRTLRRRHQRRQKNGGGGRMWRTSGGDPGEERQRRQHVGKKDDIASAGTR